MFVSIFKNSYWQKLSALHSPVLAISISQFNKVRLIADLMIFVVAVLWLFFVLLYGFFFIDYFGAVLQL